MRNFTIDFFEKSDGKIPVESFILSQDVKMRARIFRNLELLEIEGNDLREPYSKHLDDGIFELRTKQGKNTVRILYFFLVDRRIILTNGFVKKSQEIPVSEIKKAKSYREEFLNRG